MDRPPPDPVKLLEAWMEWERGEATPGRTMATLKTGGLRTMLEELAAAPTGEDASGAPAAEAPAEQQEPAAESWTPVV